MQLLELVSNLLGVLAIGLSLFIYFSDPLRRWEFLGYKPTVLILLFDPKTQKVLMIKHKKYKIWYLPQGGIYSSNINEVVEETLQRELALDQHSYKFVESIPLGTIPRKRNYKYKYTPGAVSLFQRLKGKGYLACLCVTETSVLKKKIHTGIGVEKYEIVTKKELLKRIDTKKAMLLKKIRLEY